MTTTLVMACAAAGVASWFGTEFLLRPICQFLALRKAVRSLILICNHMPAVEAAHPLTVGADRRAVSARDVERAFCDLGAQLVAFGEDEVVAARIMKLFAFEPIEAGHLLTVPPATSAGAERDAYVARIEEALRLTDSAAAAREKRITTTRTVVGQSR